MTRRETLKNLRGVFTPMITPFSARGKLDEGAFRANLRFLSASGISGVLVAGSTGEAPHLTIPERLRLIDIARASVKPPQVLIAGAGLESTAHTIELSREAAQRGADAVLLLPPAYYKPALRPDVLAAHFGAVADGVRVPTLIYSIPQYTGYRMDVEMLGRLARHPNVVGLKESSGDFSFVQAILRKVPRNFSVFAGAAPVLIDALNAGAAGGILGQSNFAPSLCAAIYEAFRAGVLESAERLHQRLMILATEITVAWGIPGIKAAVDLAGGRGGAPRLPLMPVNGAARRKIAAALKRAGDTAS
ncbi:MAG: dihydrodipicolinate synthase family protein [Terriglobia bacterium]